MADVSKMAEEWLSEHPDATKKEIWLAGYWKSTDSETRNHAFDDS